MPKFRRTSDVDDIDDPLTKALAPPPNETPAEREIRLAAEAEAQRRSDAIDEEINRQRIADRKAPKCVRVLLLVLKGALGIGKSTTLKNFQLINSPKAFRTERASWRAVVQLNVVRSIRTILDAMADAQAQVSPASPVSPLDLSRSPSPTPPPDLPTLTPEHLRLKMRLLPLQQVEEALLRRLTPAGSAEFEATHLSPLTNLPYSLRVGTVHREIAVNSTAQWKGAFTRLMSTTRSSFESGRDIDFEDPNDPGVILHACSDDMVRLWHDPTIKKLLKAQKIRLEDMAGFFLDSLERVTALRYVPTDDDILRARLKTLGVSEHRFKLKAGGYFCNLVSHDWRVFDVGGARSLVSAWASYFDDMDAIIFLAPISCFDQVVLVEDPSVNRLEDSILLWKSVVSNPLLQSTETVLFLNKIDIFKAKLVSGIKFADYVISYGNRPNDFEHAANYLKKKFSALHTQCSPKPRMFYCHLTTVTDVKSTQHILGNVKDMVLRQNLMNSSLV
ncbi:guanine nucleotide binding protein, alpha subunit [Crucibulum laeve]|uniref:Guanine nucleotide binding protein, alpha subunit n=1 Tax=Crucibulum laeve TaxID=68775 RepID=A0A5C3MGF5_9AGAR|nr:guanine nucleotide binding protein, alpha subunit [Crucibulum laeve]